ncbi:MAG: serine/threonine-protein kinase [Myxococcales bacterium]
MKGTARYELLDRIATGGMAELYRARVLGESGFAKLLAIKRILPQRANDGAFVRMLIDEARMAANLSHPNIVQVFELGRDEQGYFIAMELVSGPNLSALLRRLGEQGRRLPQACSIDIAIQALQGLDYAHKMTDAQGRPLNLVHRDVSPENLLLTTSGTVKLADFGIAKAKNRTHETRVGTLKGKLPYMSPEQIQGVPVDGRTDIFAAGLVLWECLAGSLRYDAESEYELVQQVAENRGRSLAELGVKVAPEVESALARALAHRAEDRFQTAGEFAQELMRYHRRAFPDYVPSLLGDLVAGAFEAELGELAAKLRRLEAGQDGAIGLAGSATEPVADGQLQTPPPAPRPRPKRTREARAARPEPARATPAAAPEEREAIDAAIREAALAERAARKEGRGLSAPVLVISFLLAGGLGIGGVIALERFFSDPPSAAPAGEEAPAAQGEAAGGLPGFEEPKAREPAATPPATEVREAPRPTRAPPPSNRQQAETKPAGPAAPKGMGYLNLDCEPQCEVVIDGRIVGFSPLRGYSLEAGRHRIKVQNRLVNLHRWLTLEIEPGMTTSRSVNLVLDR